MTIHRLIWHRNAALPDRQVARVVQHPTREFRFRLPFAHRLQVFPRNELPFLPVSIQANLVSHHVRRPLAFLVAL